MTRLRIARLLILASVIALPAGGGYSGGDAQASGERELVVWDFVYQTEGWGGALQELDEQFMEEHPGVTIEHVEQPFENYDNVIRTALSGETGPDVAMFLPAGHIAQFTAGLVDLSDRITPEMREQLTGWEDVSEDFDPENAIWGVPVGIEGNVFLYNRELFAQAGLDPDNPPTTYDDLIAAAGQLEEADIVPFGGGNQEGFLGAWMLTLLFPAVGTPDDALALADNELAWTDERLASTLARMREIHQEYSDPDVASMALFTDAVESFKRGEQAIFPGLTAMLLPGDNSLVDGDLAPESLGVMPPPGIDGPANYLPLGTRVAWGITKASDQQDLAFEYVQFVTGVEGATVQYELGGVFPNNNAVPLPADAIPAIHQLQQLQESYDIAFPAHGLQAGPVLDTFTAQVKLMESGDTSIEAVLEETQATRNSLE